MLTKRRLSKQAWSRRVKLGGTNESRYWPDTYRRSVNIWQAGRQAWLATISSMRQWRLSVHSVGLKAKQKKSANRDATPRAYVWKSCVEVLPRDGSADFARKNLFQQMAMAMRFLFWTMAHDRNASSIRKALQQPLIGQRLDNGGECFNKIIWLQRLPVTPSAGPNLRYHSRLQTLPLGIAAQPMP
jgi:hypothetical protein